MDDMVGVGMDMEVEIFFVGKFDEVFVGVNMGGFKGFRV